MTYNVKVIKCGVKGSSEIDAKTMYGWKDLAKTVSERNQNISLDLVETENIFSILYYYYYYCYYYYYWMVSLRPSSANIKESPKYAACSVACAPPCVHITPVLSKLRWLWPKITSPPLLRLSLTSYSCTPLLDHPNPVPTPASRNFHRAGAR